MIQAQIRGAFLFSKTDRNRWTLERQMRYITDLKGGEGLSIDLEVM
jgi:hypothetical protein